MALLKRTVQYLFHGKTNVSKIKYIIYGSTMNEKPRNTYGHGVNYTLKIINATGNDFSSSWNIPYNGNHLRKKIFANFADLDHLRKSSC